VTQWQKSSFTREPPKTKAELRQMLTEADADRGRPQHAAQRGERVEAPDGQK